MRNVLLAVLDVVQFLARRTFAGDQCCLCYSLTQFSPMLQEWHSSQQSHEGVCLKVPAALLAQDLSLVGPFHATCELHLSVPYCSLLQPHLL